jgi:hypothetical protein
MSRITKPHTALLLAIAALLVAGASQAVAQPTDLRSPDARDAGQSTQVIDLRSPDARDAGARFAGQVPEPAPKTSSSDFEWVYLFVGLAGVALVGGIATMAMRRRPRVTDPTSV